VVNEEELGGGEEGSLFNVAFPSSCKRHDENSACVHRTSLLPPPPPPASHTCSVCVSSAVGVMGHPLVLDVGRALNTFNVPGRNSQ